MAEQETRDQHWSNLISEWRASGRSQVEFCRRRGISGRALNNWLYKSPDRERVARILAARTQTQLVQQPPHHPAREPGRLLRRTESVLVEDRRDHLRRLSATVQLREPF